MTWVIAVAGAAPCQCQAPGGLETTSPATAMTHLTVEQPGDFDLDVDRRDWDTTYGPELGA